MINLGEHLLLHHIQSYLQGESVSLTETSRQQVIKARQYLHATVLNTDNVVYGINTGFGKLANVKIDKNQLKQLQINLIRSHASGLGKELPEDVVLTAMLLLANSLAKGHSGVKLETLEFIVQLLNDRVAPVAYEFGSLGASGDLAPLAHVVLGFIGEGPVRKNGKYYQSIKELGYEPLVLEEKEGLALINGTHFSTASLALALLHGIHVLKSAIIITALSVDALKGTNMAFHPAISRVRPYSGQIQVARALWDLLQGSTILESHHDPKWDQRVQDPYSLRCSPQVLGAVFTAINHTKQVVETELNSITDNPLIFPDSNLIISGGNFHAEPLALVGEYFTLALTEIATLSEKRTEKLLNPNYNENMPAFLSPHPGINSGYMIAHYAQASLVNQLMEMTMPHTPLKVSVSAHQEDHVSMAMNVGLKALKAVSLVEQVLAIEAMAASQGMDFRHKENLKSSPVLEHIHKKIRSQVPHLTEDRITKTDIDTITSIIHNESFVTSVEEQLKRSLLSFD